MGHCPPADAQLPPAPAAELHAPRTVPGPRMHVMKSATRSRLTPNACDRACLSNYESCHQRKLKQGLPASGVRPNSAPDPRTLSAARMRNRSVPAFRDDAHLQSVPS